MSSLKGLAPLALIAVLGFLCYSNTFTSPFVYDDISNIKFRDDLTENGGMSIYDFESCLMGHDKGGVQWRGIVNRQLFKTRFLSLGSLYLTHKLWGDDVRVYHATNLALHIANAWLVYLLVLYALRATVLAGSALQRHAGAAALLSALLFVSHPIMTEGVTYISQRTGLMASLFYLSCLVSYARWRTGGGWVFYALSLGAAACAMLSKEDAFTLPMAVALYEAVFIAGVTLRERLKGLAPHFAVSMIIPYVYFTENIGLEGMLSVVPRAKHLMTELVVMARYMGLLVYPVGQNLDHDVAVVESMLEPAALLSALLIAGLLALAIAARRWWQRYPELRLVSFAVGWFFLTLSMTSSIIPVRLLMVEYRVYLPALGYCVLLGAAAVRLYEGLHKAALRRAAVAAAALLPLALGIMAYERNSLWRDPVLLWSDVVAKSPNRPLGYFKRANVYDELGQNDKALEDYGKVIELNALSKEPYFKGEREFLSMSSHYNRAFDFLEDQDYSSALSDYGAVLSMDPTFALGYRSRGYAYYSIGQYELALADYDKALELDPTDCFSYNNRGMTYGAMGMLPEALKDFEAALRINPDLPEVAQNIERARQMIREAQGGQ